MQIELAQVGERVILPNVNERDMELWDLVLVGPCIGRYNVILRPLISEKGFIRAAMTRIGLTVDSVAGNEKVEALWMI